MVGSLITHTFIEFYMRTSKGLIAEERLMEDKFKRKLFEAYGVFRGCEEAAEYIARHTMMLDNAGRITMNPPLSFIKEVCVVFVDGKKSYASYRPDETVVNKDGTFDYVEFSVRKPIGDYNELVTFLMHELTHAWQDYHLRTKGTTLSSETNKVGYPTFQKYVNTGKTLESRISILLYYLDAFEKGAYESMIQGELRKIKGKKFETIKDAIDSLKNTKTYKTYEVVKTCANIYTDKTLDEKNKLIILRTVNNLSNYNFKTFNDFSEWASKRTERMLRKLDNIIPKIAVNSLDVKNHVMESAGFLDPNDFDDIGILR